MGASDVHRRVLYNGSVPGHPVTLTAAYKWDAGASSYVLEYTATADQNAPTEILAMNSITRLVRDPVSAMCWAAENPDWDWSSTSIANGVSGKYDIDDAYMFLGPAYAKIKYKRNGGESGWTVMPVDLTNFVVGTAPSHIISFNGGEPSQILFTLGLVGTFDVWVEYNFQSLDSIFLLAKGGTAYYPVDNWETGSPPTNFVVTSNHDLTGIYDYVYVKWYYRANNLEIYGPFTDVEPLR